EHHTAQFLDRPFAGWVHLPPRDLRPVMISPEPQHSLTSPIGASMPAYFVAEVEVTNPSGYEPYRAAVPATIAQYGGRFLTRGGATELIEGEPEPKRVVILEFADTAAVKRWYDSPEYQKILPPRL